MIEVTLLFCSHCVYFYSGSYCDIIYMNVTLSFKLTEAGLCTLESVEFLCINDVGGHSVP